MSYNFLAALGWSGFLVGQTVTPVLPDFGMLTQTGALGILAWVVWTQRQDAREARIEDRASTEKLIQTLTDLRENCAVNIAIRKDNTRG